MKETRENKNGIIFIVLGFIFIAALGLIDYHSDPGLSFILIYLSPVFLITWFGGYGLGITSSIISAVLWIADNRLAAVAKEQLAIPAWNLAIKLAFFIIFVFIIGRLRQAMDREARLARVDILTGLANRRHFFECAREELSRAARHKRPFTFIFMDVDNFKALNDKMGHAAGDKFLTLAGKILWDSTRDNDIVTRLGGDEFGILLAEADLEQAGQAIKRVREDLMKMVKENNYPVTFSFGAVTHLAPPSGIDEMIKFSDDLMYEAKKAGKDTVRHEVRG